MIDGDLFISKVDQAYGYSVLKIYNNLARQN